MSIKTNNYYTDVFKSSIVWALCIGLFESFQVVISTSVRYIGAWDVFVITISLFLAYSVLWPMILMPAAFLLKPLVQKRDLSSGGIAVFYFSVALFLYELFWITYKAKSDGLIYSSYGVFSSLAQIVFVAFIAYGVFKVAGTLRQKGHLKQFGLKLFSLWLSIVSYMMLYVYLKSSFEQGFNNPLYSVSLFVLFLVGYRLLLYILEKIRPAAVLSTLLIIVTRTKLFIMMMALFITLLLSFAYYSMANIPDVSSKPNVLLISIDTLRADRLSCYDEIQKKTSPNIDRIAREGYLFKRAYSPTTWTLPAHASMMTGLFPSSHEADRSLHQTMTRPVDPLPSSALTLAEILSDNGYLTAGIISNPFVSGSFGMDQGFDFYDDRVDLFEDARYLSLKDVSMLFKIFIVLKVIDRNDYDGERRVPEVNEKAIKWIKENKDKKKPFFLFLHYNEPHFKYEPPPPYNRSIDGREIPYFDDISALNKGQFSLSTAGLNDLLTLYDGEITYLDHYLGLLFNRFEEWDLLDNTIIIITSDHGESFNEHEIWQHGNSLYEEQIRVPLIIRYPGLVPEGQVIEKDIVQTLDLMPTILDMLEISMPPNIQGRSLVPLFTRETEKEFNLAFAEIRPDINWKVQNPRYGIGMKAVIYKEWKYILSDNGKEELYNLETDPAEAVNLIHKEKEKASEMKGILNSWSSTFALKKGDKKGKIEGGRLEQLRSLGYLQ